ncbi:RNA polymerase sigma factor [Fontivita pretiosa]|uniref:RNA polymerase sigma factor n=1 Tax=Fontivita pretiosa TaxID=2989684 RepID=UPI003D16A982
MDQITIEAARRGDRAAQAALLRQLQDVWFRVCLGLLGDAEDARDAVQETALRFLRDLPRFRGDSAITTWSLGIALNVSREMRRKIPAFRRLPDDSAPSPLAATSGLEGSPHGRLLLEESRSMLRAVMQQLPPRQREALLLRYFEELSIDDTAAAMNCAAGTVKATVHQALRSLRAKLTEPI